MRRFLTFCLVSLASTSGLASLSAIIAACGSADATSTSLLGGDAGKRDAMTVAPPEGGAYDASPPPPAASCKKYCDLVLETCTGETAQYASRDECEAFCALMPVGEVGDQDTNSVACRQRYAGSPARTDAVRYCLAAGPFGGGVCDDRCTSFCQLSLATCPVDAGLAPFPSFGECRTTCEGFAFRDAGTDGGGEGPDGPSDGNSLNCRLFHLRAALTNGSACRDLGADSGACR